MALPGRVDVEIGAITTNFNRGITDATRTVSQFTGTIKREAGALPQSFDRTTQSVQKTGAAIQQVTVDTKAMTLSMVGLGTTMIGLATATSRLGQAENRLEKSKVAVRRINDQIASTQKNLNRLIEQGKTNTEDYAVQLGRLETAYIDLETKQTDVKLNQDVLNDTYILFATTIANTAINSLFLLKSAFSGLSLAQLKASLTGKTQAATMVASRGPMAAYTVQTKVATVATHGLGAALKTALLPLLGITAALAAYELALAPIISEHVGFDASLSGMISSAFKADEAIETVNEDLKAYKDLAGEATDATEGQTNALKELFGLIGSGDTHPMVKFWTGVKLQQEGVLDNLLKIKSAMNDPGIRAATAGFSSAPSGGAILTTGGGGGTVQVASGVVSQSRIDRANSEIVTDAIKRTDDVELDKSIAEAAARGFEEGVPVTYKQLHGVTLAEELQKEFGISHKTLRAVEDFTALELQTTMDTIRGQRQIAAAASEAASNESLQSVLVGGGRQRVFDNDFKIPVGPSNAPAVAEHNRQLMIKLYGEDFFKPLAGQEEVLKGVIAAELKGVITDEFGLTPNTVATLKKIAQEDPARLLFNLGGGQGFGRPVMSGGNVVGHSQTLGIFTAGSGINMLARTPVKLNRDEQGLADAGHPIMALILANVREGRIPYDVYLNAFQGNSKAANEISSRLGLPNPKAVLDVFGLDQGSAKIDTSIFKETEVGLRGAEDFLTRTNLQIEGFVQRAKDQGYLSGSGAVTLNRLLEQRAIFEAEQAGFFGTNTGSAVPAQFRFGRVVSGTGMSRSRGLELLLASQGGAFGRTAGLGTFEIAPGLFTQAGIGQDSRLQREFNNIATARSIALRQANLKAVGRFAGGFGQAQLGQFGGSVGRGITQDTIDQLLASQIGNISGNRGLEFDSSGNLVSASGLIGGAIRFAQRNAFALRERSIAIKQRDAFRKSEDFLEEIQIAGLFGVGLPSTGFRYNGPLSRSLADIAKRGGGLKSGKANFLLTAQALTGGELGKRLGISGSFSPFGSTDHIFGAFNQAAGGYQYDRLIRATAAFVGTDEVDLFGVSRGHKFAKRMRPIVTRRLQEFGVRVLEGRPIFVEDVLPFVQKSKGITQERLLEALQTLDPESFERDVRLEQNLGALDLAIEKAREEGVASIFKKSGGKRRFSDLLRAQSSLQERITTPSAVRKAFRADIIDTRNEILELEAKAYFIEREEANSVA